MAVHGLDVLPDSGTWGNVTAAVTSFQDVHRPKETDTSTLAGFHAP